MSTDGSVTDWIKGIQGGDDASGGKLWQRYYSRLVRLADKALSTLPRRAADEEDVAQVAFAAFFSAVKEGRYPKLRSRDDLWKLLVEITENKAKDLSRQERASKRGGGKVRGDSAFRHRDAGSDAAGIEQQPDNEPTPIFAALAVEEFRLLIGKINRYDDQHQTLRTIVLLKMEGYSNGDIAKVISEQRPISLRSVERKLKLIRDIWSEPDES